VSVRKLAIGVLIAGGAIAIVGGIATAKIKTRSKSTTIAADSNGKANARCPRGSEAVSGGFAAPGFDPTFAQRAILPHKSKRGDDRKWKTQDHNFGTQSAKLKSIVYCDTHMRNLRVVSEDEPVPSLTTDWVTVPCPVGSVAVSGGWASAYGQDGGNVVHMSRRKGERKWKVSAFNQDRTDTEELVAYAYCDKHGPNLRATSANVNVPSGEKRSAKANCRDGEKAYSGGFKGEVGGPRDRGGRLRRPSSIAAGPFAFTSKRTGGGDWKGKAVGNGRGTHQFKVYAYCK
jgi:hypothetical protein